MANELRGSLALTFKKGVVQGTLPGGQQNFTATWNGEDYDAGIQSIGTGAHEQIGSTGDMGTAGILWVFNLDPTNYVQLGLDVAAAFQPFAKLKPGQHAFFPANSFGIWAKANTGAVKIALLWLED